MIRRLIVDDSLGQLRAAVMEDGALVEIHSEKQRADDQTESLFFGRVQAVKPSLHAAFVDIGAPMHAFLPLREDLNLRGGDMLIVQGQAKQSTDTKGLRITDQINLSGKWLVLLPMGDGVHISKKIKDPSLRDALGALGRRICPQNCGLIIRTASEDVTEQLLSDEAQALHQLWLDIQRKAKGMVKPGLLHRRLPLLLRLSRDIRDLSEIVVNSEASYQTLVSAQQNHMLAQNVSIVYHRETSTLLFDANNIESQIDKALKKRVWLPCGGYLVIDHCEAMTVIDVNSGKMILGKDLEDTALRVNLEAAEEVMRQMRLRDIGGVILVDFIDMKDDMHKLRLLQAMKEAAARDRTPISIEGFTRLGLMEITRRRKHEQLHKHLRCGCSYCNSVGEILSGEEVAYRAMRQTRRMYLNGQRGPFLIRCGASAAQALSAMAAPEGPQVYYLASSGRHAEKYDIEQLGEDMTLPSGVCALKIKD